MPDMRVIMIGADELAADMKKVLESCPDELNRAMQRTAKGFRDDCNAKMPASYDKGKRPFRKSWKTENSYGSLGIIEETTITNKAPHWHLVENGHRKFDFHGHDTGGFVPGRHYAERTRGEYEDKFPQTVNDTVQRFMERNNL